MLSTCYSQGPVKNQSATSFDLGTRKLLQHGCPPIGYTLVLLSVNCQKTIWGNKETFSIFKLISFHSRNHFALQTNGLAAQGVTFKQCHLFLAGEFWPCPQQFCKKTKRRIWVFVFMGNSGSTNCSWGKKNKKPTNKNKVRNYQSALKVTQWKLLQCSKLVLYFFLLLFTSLWEPLKPLAFLKPAVSHPLEPDGSDSVFQLNLQL